MISKRETRCDDNHLGHFFFNYMKKIPNEICQIEAATGEQETCASVLSRSIRLAQYFGKLGLVPGDPIAVGGRNHLDVHIPVYAALMSGLPMAGIDPTLRKHDIKHLLGIVGPNMVFCDYQDLEQYQLAVQELGLDTRIVSFGGGNMSFEKLMDSYQDLPPEDEFQIATFNTDEVYCWLCSTSGSTGRPKVVAHTHSHFFKIKETAMFNKAKDGQRKTALNVSTLHYLSGCYNALLMPIDHIKLQTATPLTTELVIDIINKYKPRALRCSPSFIPPLMNSKKHFDLTCFELLDMGGMKIHNELLKSLKDRTRADIIIYQGYGQTEAGSAILWSLSRKPYWTIEDINPNYELKLVAPETGKEILKPNVIGELFHRGPIMACYYNDPESTKAAFTDDGYFKTGDLFYKDERGSYYFVERLKMLLKYKNYQVVPPEVEEVILKHVGVADVCVTGVPHAHDGEHVVACVVRRQGAQVSAQEIKDLVAEHLSDSKRLRGGVVFLDALPQLSTGKVARLEVKKLVLTALRE